MQMSRYVRLSKGLKDKGKLVKEDDIYDFIDDNNKDWYRSIYYYNTDQYNQFKKTGSVAGFTDVKTDQLVFDLDNTDQSQAQEDTKELIFRLNDSGVPDESIQVYFSGNKGFHINVDIDKELTPKNLKTIATKLGKGLKSLDPRVYNANRIFRIAGTKHQTSNLYKIPLTFEQLNNYGPKEIRNLASNLDNIPDEINYEVASLDNSFFEAEEEPTKINDAPAKILDTSTRPDKWKDYKWALMQGEFKKGERHEALMVLAATCKGLYYDKETAYYMCKSALKKSLAKYGPGGTSKDELWLNIVGSVYSPNWKGGQYSPENNAWLSQYCDEHGFNGGGDDNPGYGILNATDLAKSFIKYIRNIDELTLSTGIPCIDESIRLSVGNSIGIVAAPSVGKTSIAIQLLNEASKNDYGCAFFSLDMFRDLVGQKLVQKHTGKTEDEIIDIADTEEYEEMVIDLMNNEYGNMSFIDRSALTIDELRRIAYHLKENSKQDLKLIVVDYNELISTDLSDNTTSTAKVAQELRGLAKELEVLMVVLYQPSKITGSPSDPIKSYRSIKGSSAIEQAASIVLGMHRPGFNPERPDDDKFMNIRVLKNRMGGLANFDLFWDGLTGHIREMTSEERTQLKAIRDRIAAEEDDGGNGWN